MDLKKYLIYYFPPLLWPLSPVFINVSDVKRAADSEYKVYFAASSLKREIHRLECFDKINTPENSDTLYF